MAAVILAQDRPLKPAIPIAQQTPQYEDPTTGPHPPDSALSSQPAALSRSPGHCLHLPGTVDRRHERRQRPLRPAIRALRRLGRRQPRGRPADQLLHRPHQRPVHGGAGFRRQRLQRRRPLAGNRRSHQRQRPRASPCSRHARPLAPVPYALQALSAGSTSVGLSISQQPSTNAVSVNDDLLINATNNGAGTWTAKRATVGSVLGSLNAALVSAALSNATFTAGSTNLPTDAYKTVPRMALAPTSLPAGPGGDILFPDWSGRQMAKWRRHFGLGGAWMARHTRRQPAAERAANHGQLAGRPGCLFRLYLLPRQRPRSGISNGRQRPLRRQLLVPIQHGARQPGLGNSKLVSFITQSSTSNVIGYASIRGVANSYTSDRAMLRFYSGPRHALDNSAGGGWH